MLREQQVFMVRLYSSDRNEQVKDSYVEYFYSTQFSLPTQDWSLCDMEKSFYLRDKQSWGTEMTVFPIGGDGRQESFQTFLFEIFSVYLIMTGKSVIQLEYR